MFEAHIHEWMNLLIRWIHFIVGAAWVGASFYFNWLENNLDRGGLRDEAIAGNLWAIHGGGIYHLKKFKTGPAALPRELHWFRWEAYATWLSGMALLLIVYYFNAHLYLIDSGVKDLTAAKAVIISVACIFGSWFVYDGLCRSPLKRSPMLLAVSIFLYLTLLAYFLSEVFSGRGAYIHVGVVIGTMMAGNVFFVIIPAQKKMIEALGHGNPPDPDIGRGGLLRSRHNNYFTLPILFVMISSHFPGTYSHPFNWLVLSLISLVGAAVRHYFNVRKTMRSLWCLLAAGFLVMVMVMWWTSPARFDPSVPAEEVKSNTMDSIFQVVQNRCAGCHAAAPAQPGFSAPPAGLVLDSVELIEHNRTRIYQTVVLTNTMPIGNLTKMTDEERNRIKQWYLRSGQGDQ